jgi:uncharacterized protein YlxP (DUF503 family)
MEEYSSLNKKEKIQVIKSHIKNLQYSKYNLEISILTEQAIDIPNESNIIGFQMQLDDLLDKETALNSELEKVEAEPDDTTS